MADGRHLEKSKIGHISAKVRPIGTKFGLETHIGLPYRTGRQNFELLKIQDGGRRNLEKLKNGHIAATVHAINIKFGTLMHIGPANRYSSQNFQLLKTQTQDGGRRHLTKLKNGHDSATVRPIGTKFGLVMHTGLPNRQLKFPTF